MKTHKHNGLGCFVCCLIMCVSLFLTACGRDDTSGSVAASGETTAPAGNIAQGREWVYVPEVYPLKERMDYTRMQPVGDTFCYILQEETANSPKYVCRYSLADGELEESPIDWPEGGDNWISWDVGYRFFTQDQGWYMTVNAYPEDVRAMKRFLCRFDPEGNCLFSRDITEQAGWEVSMRGLAVDRQGRLYLSLDNGEILLYTGDGEYHGSVSYGSPEDKAPARIKGACNGADGRFYVCYSRESMDIAGETAKGEASVLNTLAEIDFEKVKLTEVATGLPNIKGICTGIRQHSDSAGLESGSAGQDNASAGQGSDPAGQGSGSAAGSGGSDGGYDLLLYDDRAVYGYSVAGQDGDQGPAGEELFAWMDSDINGYCVANLYLLEDGRLCAVVEDWVNDDRAIVALERTRAEQAPRREELVLATVDGGSDLAAMAVRFNRGNSQYHITVKKYESLTDLYNAMLKKEPMDLIDLEGLNVQRLAARGLLEDLAPYVDRSEAFGRSDFVDGLLDAYTCGGILAGIPEEYKIYTVVGSRAQLENKAGLTLEELLSVMDRYPGAKAFDGVTREEVMQYIVMFNEDTFIDWDSGACHFDSEEFKAVLEYVSRFPDEVVSGKEEDTLSARIQNGEVLFMIAELYPSIAFGGYDEIFGEDAACIGFPTADGRGGHILVGSEAYAIAAVSEHKESAWGFIEKVLTQEKEGFYKDFHISYPAMKKVLEERARSAMRKWGLTRDDLNAVLELIPEAIPFFSVGDDEIIKIITEEAPAYYSGQKGIDDVAGIIQNRVQLYVDENS